MSDGKYIPGNDHDLLIQMNTSFSASFREMKEALNEMGLQMREMRSLLDSTVEKQRDADSRLTNVTGTVVRVQSDQREITLDIGKLRESHDKRISTVEDDMTMWKLYAKVFAVLATPVYLAMLALAIEAAKRALFP